MKPVRESLAVIVDIALIKTLLFLNRFKYDFKNDLLINQTTGTKSKL